MFTRRAYIPGTLGTVGSLRGRVLTLLSGDAATASNKSFITSARAGGHVVRGWDFDDASLATSPPANYPATNYPWTTWYATIVSGAVQ